MDRWGAAGGIPYVKWDSSVMDEQLPQPEIDVIEKVDGNGFEVRHFKGMRWAYGPCVPTKLPEMWQEPTEHWTVQLPHSCDEWVIAEGAFDTVVADLESFIAEAQQALRKLRELGTS